MDDDVLLRWPELARVAKLSRSAVDRLEKIGRFPKRVRLGPRAVAWKRQDIEGWLSKLGSDQSSAIPVMSEKPAMLDVRAEWDDEAGVWIATSEDVPGLCVEASTFDELVDVATELTPELLELNHVEISGPVSIHITAERTMTAKAA